MVSCHAFFRRKVIFIVTTHPVTPGSVRGFSFKNPIESNSIGFFLSVLITSAGRATISQYFFYLFSQSGNRFEEVFHDPIIRPLENGGFRILINGHDDL